MNEKRLIDANAVIRHFSNLERENEDALFTYEDVKRIIRNAPTAEPDIDVKLNSLNPSESDTIVAVIDYDRLSVSEIERLSDSICERAGNVPVIFIPKGVEFTVQNKTEVICELQTIIDRIEQEADDE